MSVDIDTLFEMMDEGQPVEVQEEALSCLLYTSPSPRD